MLHDALSLRTRHELTSALTHKTTRINGNYSPVTVYTGLNYHVISIHTHPTWKKTWQPQWVSESHKIILFCATPSKDWYDVSLLTNRIASLFKIIQDGDGTAREYISYTLWFVEIWLLANLVKRCYVSTNELLEFQTGYVQLSRRHDAGILKYRYFRHRGSYQYDKYNKVKVQGLIYLK